MNSDYMILDTYARENKRYFNYYNVSQYFLTTVKLIDDKTAFYDFRAAYGGHVNSGHYAMNRSKKAGIRKVYFSRKGFYINADGGRLYFNTMISTDWLTEKEA